MMCGRKIRHENFNGAMIVKGKMKAKGYNVRYLQAYHCDKCGGWHLGNSTAQEGLAKANLARIKADQHV